MLDGNSEIGARVWSDLGSVISSVKGICLDQEQSQIFHFCQKRPIIIHKCALCSELSFFKVPSAQL